MSASAYGRLSIQSFLKEMAGTLDRCPLTRVVCLREVSTSGGSTVSRCYTPSCCTYLANELRDSSMGFFPFEVKLAGEVPCDQTITFSLFSLSWSPGCSTRTCAVEPPSSPTPRASHWPSGRRKPAGSAANSGTDNTRQTEASQGEFQLSQSVNYALWDLCDQWRVG